MRRVIAILATTLVALAVLGAPADARKAKRCASEQSCKKAIAVEQTTRTHQDKRGNDWELSNGHRA